MKPQSDPSSNLPFVLHRLDRELTHARQSWPWPFSHLIIFLFALPSLILWGSAGLGTWWVLDALGWVKAGITVQILAVVIPAFIGFAVQQWRFLADAEETKRTHRKEAQAQIGMLPTLLKGDSSEGAHRYLEYAQSDDWIWQDVTIKNRLDRVWEANACVELQNVVKLHTSFELSETERINASKQIGQPQVEKSLIWAYRVLDKEWQQRSLEILPKYVRLEIEKQSWKAIFHPSPHVHPWRPCPPWNSIGDMQGPRQLELPPNSFGSSSAENDFRLLETRVNPSALTWLQELKPTLLFGKPGSGKTSLCLFHVIDSVHDNQRTLFPIYHPQIASEATPHAQLNGLGKTLAAALLYYLAINPREFVERDIEGKAAIACLLGTYICAGRELSLRFHRNGLPAMGLGSQMLKELDQLVPKKSKNLPEDELIDLLRVARPSDYTWTFVLVDMAHETKRDESTLKTAECIHALIELMWPLESAGTFLKMLLPDELRPCLKLPNLPGAEELIWTNDELTTLLQKRLFVYGVESLAIGCDVEARFPNPDERLVKAAQGLPGRLIQLGNELSTRASNRTSLKITAADLDDVLGT